MIRRILSTVALWLIIILSLVYGGITAGVFLLTLAAFLTQRELYQLFEKMGYQPQTKLGLACGILLLLGGYFIIQMTTAIPLNIYSDLFVLSILATIISLIQADPQTSKWFELRTLPTLFGIVYVPYMMQFYMRLAHNYVSIGASTWGLMLVVWLVVVAKFTDVGGLLIGTACGKTPLAPHISPKKTWEGAMGGILLSSFLGLGLVLFFPTLFPYNFTPFIAFTVALPVGAISIISDLLESFIKRRAGVKDSGSVIPGIGGAFDLTDSLLLTAPVGYLLLYNILM